MQLQRWLRISLFNLLLIALIGLVMRYKIIYPLPFVDQRNLLHAHSHFAFAGWLTQVLMSLLVSRLTTVNGRDNFRRYNPVLYGNLITAYGMLLTFPFQGYAFLSILFSTLSIGVSYWFAIQYWRDLNRSAARNISHRWFKAALLFNAVSSAGAFSLAYMLATHSAHSERYLASVYFFLHFQYNGWFFFACMGLLSFHLSAWGASEKKLKLVYLLFLSACVPAYFLSALWLPVPGWAYVLVVAAVCAQMAGWAFCLLIIRKALPVMKKQLSSFARLLLVCSAAALTIKLCLQSGSVIPPLSRLAFGFRPIVIGYLHLVLLGVITLFLLGYIISFRMVPVSSLFKTGCLLFAGGIILNELLLMVQGIADLGYRPLPSVNHLLLAAALVLFTGMLIINLGCSGKYDPAHKLPEK
ncbi:MAG: hypothetical protein U0U70_12585 [Chitinophagaceae bacterium]